MAMVLTKLVQSQKSTCLVWLIKSKTATSFSTDAKGNVVGNHAVTAVGNGKTVSYAAGDNLTITQNIDNATGEQTYTYALSNDIKVGNDGKDGKDGVDGKIGVNGKDGSAVVINGKDGSIGLNGKDGKDGLTIKGANGQDGVDGKNGKDGMTLYRIRRQKQQQTRSGYY